MLEGQDRPESKRPFLEPFLRLIDYNIINCELVATVLVLTAVTRAPADAVTILSLIVLHCVTAFSCSCLGGRGDRSDNDQSPGNADKLFGTGSVGTFDSMRETSKSAWLLQKWQHKSYIQL